MKLSNNGMKVLTFEDLLNLPNGERVIDMYNGIESVYIKVGSLQGNIFLCSYLNGEDSAIQMSEKKSKQHVFALIEDNSIDLQFVKQIILAQLKNEYEIKVEIVENIYK
jgi:hypothetical protein